MGIISARQWTYYVKDCVPALPERYLLNGQGDVDLSPDGF